MINFTFARDEVQAVIAYTLAEKNASNCIHSLSILEIICVDMCRSALTDLSIYTIKDLGKKSIMQKCNHHHTIIA